MTYATPRVLACLSPARLPLLAATLCVLVASLAPAQPVVDQWRYSVQHPGENWNAAEFDDGQWREAYGGFGMPSTPNARVGTNWATENIWLRKSFNLDTIPAKPALLVHHDDKAEIYLNGTRLATLKGYTKDYKTIELPAETRSALKSGKNVLAVHCHQNSGGQFIDAHLVDADNVPLLPKANRISKPFQSHLITEWGAKVTAENAWTEYPRPQMRRADWTNLNGLWDYAVTPKSRKRAPKKWAGKILVPFCLESKLGGVNRLLNPDEALWYRTAFHAKATAGKILLLNFEAVDYRCEAFVNGKSVGRHQGGNTPFTLDVTAALRDGGNELVVRVEDDTEKFQLRGKQTINPRGIWYTQVSGIWQTVWLEEVSTAYIKDLKIATDPHVGAVTVRANLGGKSPAGKLRLVVKDGDDVVAEATGKVSGVTVGVDNAKLWSPDSPHLYDLEVTLLDDAGEKVDRVDSYAGIRSVGKQQDAEGNWRFTLNGKEIFHWGPLDQGWWPDGLLTPPSDEAMAFDVEWLKAAGFNMIRKHIKVEPRRYYYHCDRLGMLLWQDQVSGGPSPRWSRLEPGPRDMRWPDKQHQQFMLELERMVDALENHPSIAVWVPFNESWGQHRTMEVGRWMVQRDPTRLVNIASGGNFWPMGDIVDEHRYPHPGFPFSHGIAGRFDKYIKVIGEFGGHGYPFPDHLWDAGRKNWGYGGLPQNEDEYKERYATSLKKLNELRAKGIAAGVYTQTTDVEGEINGLMTYDRKVIKISAEKLAELHKILFTPTQAEETFEPNPAFRSQKTDRKPGKPMPAAAIRRGLKSHDQALYIKSGWIRDPYITLGPDDEYYYLTGTQMNPEDPRDSTDPYNTGLGVRSAVGEFVRVWRSKDLIDWEYQGELFGLKDTVYAEKLKRREGARVLWAPEVHWLGDRWALVHCPQRVASLAVTQGSELKGPWTHTMGAQLGRRHDPSLFQDDDGSIYLLWQNTMVAPLSKDLTRYLADGVRIDPAGSRRGPNGNPIRRIGHEGATMMKVGGKYVHLGAAWSTDQGRKGSYNLYYCVADKVTGPYGPRKFAGRFLGHGTPFQSRDGKWWCTAFFNANVPPLPKEGIQERDLSKTAQTINEQGVTIVPLDVRVLDSGQVYIRAKDPAYATPGPDESQTFRS